MFLQPIRKLIQNRYVQDDLYLSLHTIAISAPNKILSKHIDTVQTLCLLLDQTLSDIGHNRKRGPCHLILYRIVFRQR